MPEDVETPSVVVQIQRLADRSNVQLTSIKTNNYSDYGSIRATEFEVRITGKYFDVDDFLYRLHSQVTVNGKDKPVIGGRLFATTSVDLTLDQGDSGASGAPKGDDVVVGTVKVLAFSSVPAGATAAAAPTSPTSAPATTPTTADDDRRGHAHGTRRGHASDHRHPELRRYPVIRRRHLAAVAATAVTAVVLAGCGGGGGGGAQAQGDVPAPGTSLAVRLGREPGPVGFAGDRRPRHARRGRSLGDRSEAHRLRQLRDAPQRLRPAGEGRGDLRIGGGHPGGDDPRGHADQRRSAGGGPRRDARGAPPRPRRTRARERRSRTRGRWRPTSTSPASPSWPRRAIRSRPRPSSSWSRRSRPDQVELELSGGLLPDGTDTVTLKEGESITLYNATAKRSYKIKLVDVRAV